MRIRAKVEELRTARTYTDHVRRLATRGSWYSASLAEQVYAAVQVCLAQGILIADLESQLIGDMARPLTKGADGGLRRGLQ